MRARTLLESPSVRVVDYQCTAGPHDAAFPECHTSSCLAFVRSGSFGYRVGSARHELVPGALLVGRLGDEYVCTHEHRCGGDRCLSFHFAPAVTDELGAAVFRTRGVAPLVELGVIGALAARAADGDANVGLDEVALLLANRLAGLDRGTRPTTRTSPADRKRAIRAALHLRAHAAESIRLDALAAEAGVSAFHFLRTFTRVVGTSPHQYLVGCRLENAVALLTDESRPITDVAYAVGFRDLSNFVRTFRRAAGVSPRAFRRASVGHRRILQERVRASP
jgi:AraC family transcriptional regulator